jgi:2-dehydropantoate 2-reductase
MNILIYGVGVQGSLYGARSFEAGHDVTLLARGLRLADLRGSRRELVDNWNACHLAPTPMTPL